MMRSVNSFRPCLLSPSVTGVRCFLMGASLVVLLACGGAARAENEGQGDLDQATEVKLNASSMADLERVVELCESAIEKGLDEGSTLLAKSLLTSTLYDHASRFSEAIFGQTPPNPQWPLLRQYAVRDLEKALEHDDTLGDAHLLLARLQMLPRGDTNAAKASAARAVELFADDKEKLSEALVLHAAFVEDADEKLSAYERAIQLNPKNMDAWRDRGVLLLRQQKFEEALTSFQKLLEESPDDLAAHQRVVVILAQLGKFDEAFKILDKAIEANPESTAPYHMRAGLHVTRGDNQAAIEDLNSALKVDPKDTLALIQRSQIHQETGDKEAARKDIEEAIRINPDAPEAILQRGLVAATEGNLRDSIRDVKTYLQVRPQNPIVWLQLARLYVMNDQPRRAIHVYDELLKADESNIAVLRGRGDAYLSVGKHAAAIADYDKALEAMPDFQDLSQFNADQKEVLSGILNNLAWVLSTSKDDSQRNGKRGLELAIKACEATDYKAAHILSTLAAAYAETGDFDKALEWSQKSVEVDKGQTPQLADEVASYTAKKPWRELQEIQEKEDEGDPKADDIPVDSEGDPKDEDAKAETTDAPK